MSEQELIYLLALQKVPNIGDISAKKLLRTLGSAEAIFKSTTTDIRGGRGVPGCRRGMCERGGGFI